ncbi:MAG: hypothetical protein KIT72_02635 [Polyangiaceae bacterium]|nr:hypothetical protein [Polyangiaceae bacterium]MCW5789296.1 hypothetical protein [Polyangiaceae bacterium]
MRGLHQRPTLVRGRIKHWLLARAPLAGLLLLIALAVRVARQGPPERSLPGLAGMLAEATGVEVLPGEIRWEPSRGALKDLTLGRPVLFTGATPGGPRDVYRAFVRVSREGQPLSVHRVRNLTDTEVGDDVGLELIGQTAVFSTIAFGRVQGMSVLDTRGIRAEDKPPRAFDRFLLAITSFQATGSFAGVGRSDVLFEIPAQRAALRMEAERITVDLGAAGRNLVFDVAARELVGDEGGQAYAAKAVIQRHFEKPLILWGVDTVRAEIGPGPIAWLEDKVFGARDTVRRTSYQLFDKGGAESELKEETAEAEPVATVLDASKLEGDQSSWPPPAVPSLWKETKPGEGEWVPVELPWLAKSESLTGSKEPPPSYFYKTFIRPDPKRPYAELQLIAMDMRRLELGMEAGFEDPKPLTGTPGSGRLPREPEVLKRVVGTFNGAFKTDHGKYGMMVSRRVLLPPIPGGATVVVTDDSRVGLGSWPESTDIPANIVSFRQNLDPLVEDGVANPTGRYIWGWQIAGTSVMTERTALCVTPSGHLYYGWSNDIDGPTLGRALRQAGCLYGMHLDMNPKHCGFVFTDIIDLNKKEFQLAKAHPEMGIAPDKFVRWSPKDFFYVMLRDPTPSDPSQIAWSPAPGTQPSPAWLPGIFRGEMSLGTLDIELFSFEPGRVSWSLTGGTQELIEAGAGPKRRELDGDDKHRVVAAIGLGNTTDQNALGLAFTSEPVVSLKPGHANLVLSGGELQLLGSATDITPSASLHVAQLPLLAEGSELTANARARGSLRRRGALCVTERGRVLVALGRHDSSDPLASVLLRAGCRRVAELDRGSQVPTFVHRAGTDTPPLGGYEATALYAIGAPMRPHAFRWKPAGSRPSTKPSSQDYKVPGVTP